MQNRFREGQRHTQITQDVTHITIYKNLLLWAPKIEGNLDDQKEMARGFEDSKRDEVVLPLVQHVKNTDYTRSYAFPDGNNDDDDKAEQKLNARVYV